MKFCSNCKKEVPNEGKFCPNCGKAVEEVKEENVKDNAVVKETSEKNNVEVKETAEKDNTVVNNEPAKQSNPLAITGFVISIVSILCCGITSFLGLIFSIIGLVEAKKKNNAGKGLAIAGIIISAILLFLLIILYVFAYSATLIDTLNL